MYEAVILFADDWNCVFVLFCYLDEASCIWYCWQLDDARSYIQLKAFVGVLTN